MQLSYTIWPQVTWIVPSKYNEKNYAGNLTIQDIYYIGEDLSGFFTIKTLFGI